MITYVNTVLVSNNSTANKPLATNPASVEAGQFIIMNCDEGISANAMFSGSVADANTIKIGMGTGKTTTLINPNGTTSQVPVIKWSNEIKKADIKSLKELTYTASTEDAVEIDFSNIEQEVLDVLAQGGKRVIVRLTFKDMEPRYRKWTESYEYITAINETAANMATKIASLINKQVKRARVTAVAASGKITLTAMPYDDDNSVDSLNWANKVRFSANVYYTDPKAAAFASNNKYFPTGVVITKTPGVQYPAEAKLVRDRESQAMGYLGVLNRGEGTWPIIKPEMATDLSAHYNALTLEFENMYRAADDIFRKTKQTVEIYSVQPATALKAALDEFISGEEASTSEG